MTEEAQLHFERAAECMEDAQILLDNKRPAAGYGSLERLRLDRSCCGTSVMNM